MVEVIDLAGMRMVQEKAELRERNRRAAQYSAECRLKRLKKKVLTCSVFVLCASVLVAIYFLTK